VFEPMQTQNDRQFEVFRQGRKYFTDTLETASRPSDDDGLKVII
jgi:hypothetical protein